MDLRALALGLLSLLPAYARAQDAAADPPPLAPPPIRVWLESSGGVAANRTGQGTAFRGGLNVASTLDRRDFVRLRWSYFGGRWEPDRHPHAEWTATTGLLYGVHYRKNDAIASVAVGLGVTSGFTREEILYETAGTDAYRWYRPRRFLALSALGDAFIGAGTRTVAFGITVSADANPIRQTGSVQATFILGAIP